jgi:cyanophycin synthetase
METWDEDIKIVQNCSSNVWPYNSIRQEKHLRGRTEERIDELIFLNGIAESGKILHMKHFLKVEAIKRTINNAQELHFIVAFGWCGN